MAISFKASVNNSLHSGFKAFICFAPKQTLKRTSMKKSDKRLRKGGKTATKALFLHKNYTLFQLIPVKKYSMESVSLSCNELKSISNATSIHINSTIFKITNIDEVKQNIRLSNLKKLCQYPKFNIIEPEENLVEDFKVNMPINLTRMSIGHTELMKNDIYYNIYCIGINAIFSSLLPFFALMFFNVRIALKLRNKQVKHQFIIDKIFWL